MSKPKSKFTDEQKAHAVTKGNPPAPKPLPDVIPLTRSQAVSLVALANDEQGILKRMGELEQALIQTRQARMEILGEVGDAEAIAANYQLDAANRQLVKPTPQG